MAACVEVWESEAERLHYHPSGYVALGADAQVQDLTAVHERQQRIGYPSELFVGTDEVAAHMRSLYHDWRAPDLSVCLHESRRRLRLQPGVDRRPRAVSRSRPAPGSRRASRSPALSSTTPARSRSSTPTRATSPPSRSSSPSGRGSRRCGRCSACLTGSTSASPMARSSATSRCGPTGTCRRARPRLTRRSFVTDAGVSSPVLHVDSDGPAARRRWHADHRRALGRLLQARPRVDPGRRGSR